MNYYSEEVIELHIDSKQYKQLELIADASFISPTDVILQAIKEFLEGEPMRQEVTEAAEWLCENMQKNTFAMAAEKYNLQSNEMNQLYAEYARLRAGAR